MCFTLSMVSVRLFLVSTFPLFSFLYELFSCVFLALTLPWTYLHIQLTHSRDCRLTLDLNSYPSVIPRAITQGQVIIISHINCFNYLPRVFPQIKSIAFYTLHATARTFLIKYRFYSAPYLYNNFPDSKGWWLKVTSCLVLTPDSHHIFEPDPRSSVTISEKQMASHKQTLAHILSPKIMRISLFQMSMFNFFFSTEIGPDSTC